MTEQSQHLNAAQLAEISKRMEAQVNTILDRIQLRKWSVEQALAICSSLNGSAHTAPAPNSTAPKINDPLTLAQAVYDFVSLPSRAKLDIGG